LISSSIIVENGYIAAPSQSGLGIEVNETLARAHPYTGTKLHLEMSPLPNAYRSQ
jgi:galactonate dehydratase